MAGVHLPPEQNPVSVAVDAARIDFSLLVGREATLFSEQFPGKPLISRVIQAGDREIVIDRKSHSGMIDNLVNNQKVIIRVPYKGQQVTVPAILKRAGKGKCRLLVGDKIVPLSRRRFARMVLSRSVKLAVMPVSTFHRKKLATLRWLETVTLDISGGGVLIDFSNYLENPTYLFMNIDLSEFSFPSLVLGQVLYCLPRDTSHFSVGLEFIIRESSGHHFPATTLRQLPRAVLAYGEEDRMELNKKIIARMQNNNQF